MIESVQDLRDLVAVIVEDAAATTDADELERLRCEHAAATARLRELRWRNLRREAVVSRDVLRLLRVHRRRYRRAGGIGGGEVVSDVAWLIEASERDGVGR